MIITEIDFDIWLKSSEESQSGHELTSLVILLLLGVRTALQIKKTLDKNAYIVIINNYGTKLASQYHQICHTAQALSLLKAVQHKCFQSSAHKKEYALSYLLLRLAPCQSRIKVIKEVSGTYHSIDSPDTLLIV